MVEDIRFWEADIYISPPADGHESEEDTDQQSISIILVVGN
nr:unnamed protein product [Callosobruchus chinensis]